MTQITHTVARSKSLEDPFHVLKEAEFRASETEDAEIVVDLTSMQALTSENLNDLIRLQAKLRMQERTLVLENACEVVLEVFAVTRLDRLFTIRDPSLP